MMPAPTGICAAGVKPVVGQFSIGISGTGSSKPWTPPVALTVPQFVEEVSPAAPTLPSTDGLLRMSAPFDQIVALLSGRGALEGGAAEAMPAMVGPPRR